MAQEKETPEVKEEIKAPKPPKAITPTTLQEFTKVVIDIKMGERPKTHPMRQGMGMEGYPEQARILKVLRNTINTQKAVDKINSAIDWVNGGTPNHHTLWLPKALVKGEGMPVGIDAVWEPIMHQGRVINYVRRLKFSN